VISELLNDHQERVAERSTIVTPQKVLANLRRLRLRCGVRVADVQDLTRLQPDGKVTVAEFRRLLHEVGMKVDDDLAQQAFAEVDKARHHKISWAELWAAMAPTPTDVLRELRVAKNKKRVTVAELIQPYDSNADNVLTAGEFHRCLDALGFDLDDGEVRNVLRQFDREKSRQVSARDLEYALDQLGGSPAPNKRAPFRETWSGDELLPPKGSTQTAPDLAMDVPQGGGNSRPSSSPITQPMKTSAPISQSKSETQSVEIPQKHLQGALTEVLQDFEPSLLQALPKPKQSISRPESSVKAVISQLRSLRLLRGISLADLKSFCDANGDAKLTKEHFLQILLKVGIQADPALAASVFDTIDVNRNGKISWEELWAAARPDVTDVLQALHQQSVSIERLLRENDSSGDGALSFSEFQKLLTRLGMEIDQETATEVFKRLDADGDQQLSLKTFLAGRDSPAGRRSPTSLSRSTSPDRRSRLQSVLDDYLTREQLRNMIVETGVAADEEHLLDRIFQDLDPNGFGRISRRELWEELDRFLPSGEEEVRRQDPMPRSMKPRLPSSPSPAALPEPRYQSPKSASGHPLGSQAWELLHRIYGRLAGPDVKVSTIALIQEIRQDVHVRNEGLLERPVVGIGFGQGPSISLDAALQHVLRQVSGEHSLLEFTTWERFNWLLLEAQRFCQMAEVSPRQTEPWHHAGRVRRPSLPSPRGNGWSQILSAGGSSMSSCPNPDEEPGGAIEWMAKHLGFSGDLLYRLFDMFRQGAAETPKLVGRDRFIQMVQASPRLQSALLTSPLINSTQVVQPLTWGDFLWYLSQVDSPSISWSDVLATACWCRLVSLGLASGQGHPSQTSPRMSVAESRARLDDYRRRAAQAAQVPPRSPLRSPTRNAIPSTSLPCVQKLPPHRDFDGSPLAAVDASFARVSGQMPPQPRMSRHPFLPDADDDFPPPPPPASAPTSVHPPPPPLTEPPGPDSSGKRVGVRFQVNRSYAPSELEQIEAEFRQMFRDLSVKSVRWQDARPV